MHFPLFSSHLTRIKARPLDVLYLEIMSQHPALPIDPTRAEALTLPPLLEFAESGIVSRTLLATPSLRVVLFALAAGQELTEHTSSRRALVQILSGVCEFKFNGSWQTLAVGELLHMPPNHAHAVRVGQMPCAFLLILHSDGCEAPLADTDSASEANA